MLPRRIPTAIVLLFSALLILSPTSQVRLVAQAPPPNGPGELAPQRVIQPGGISREASGFFSPRTLRVAIDVDRDGARLRSYTLKDIPFIRPLASQEIDAEGKNPRVEVALIDRGGRRYRRSLELPLCFEHPPDAPPHVMGDQTQLHRDTFVLELPEVEGFDRLEVATYAARSLGGDRRAQLVETLDARRFTPAGGKSRYRDLLFAAPSRDLSPAPPKPIGVIWPEDIGDTEIYRVEGNESEGLRRINVVVVPDAYLPGDKDLLITQFQSLARYPGIFPIEEHKSLVNFVLVFAYSHENGPDQCDCGIVRDTAMGTHFGDLPPPYDGCGGHSCLTYQSGDTCDVDRSGNITEALLRAPLFDQSMGDTKLLLVQSSRAGGCGVLGDGTTISANSLLPGTWHEMSHGWASLRDEYVDHTGCGGTTSEINTSTNSSVGAWPEWIADLGPPREGADHYLYCRYGPTGTCLMAFGGGWESVPLCPVCTQRWALVFYGSARVSPTAPIESSSPPSVLSTQTGIWTDFSVATRLPTGLGIANEMTWQIQGPGYPSPVTIATGNPAIRMPFDLAGSYVLAAKVIADANLIKPVKYGPNVDTATWNVSVALGPPPLEVSPPGSPQPVTFSDEATIHWEDGAVSHSATFNLYRGTIAELSQGSFGACLAPSVPANTASDPAQPGINEAWFYLVAGKTAGAIGPLGQDSSGASRGNGAACF